MANTISSSMLSTATPSITQLESREVGDEIRYLGIGNSKLTALIENSMFDNGQRKSGKGLISKRSVKNVRYEMFTRTFRPYKFTVTAGTTAASVTFASNNGIQVGCTLINSANKTMMSVITLATTVGVTGESIGPTTFSCAVGDVLLLGAPAVKEGSDASIVFNGSDDQNHNILQFSRWSVSISWVLEATKMLAGGARFPREKMYMLWEALADQERTMLFGSYSTDHATANYTTITTNGNLPTTQGLWNLAANSYDAQGSLTLDKIRKNLPLAMGDTINDNQTFIAFVGNELFARIQEELNAKHYNVEKEGELAQFGIKSTKLVTSGPTIELVKHNAFNAGAGNSMLVFAPENIGYVHLEGHDMSPNNGIQLPAVHGKQDELYAYYGVETKDAGNSICAVTNCF